MCCLAIYQPSQSSLDCFRVIGTIIPSRQANNNSAQLRRVRQVSYVIHFIFNQKNIYNMNSSCHSSGNVQLMVQNYSKYLANENLVRHLWPGILVKGPLHLLCNCLKRKNIKVSFRNKISKRSSQNQTSIHVHRLEILVKGPLHLQLLKRKNIKISFRNKISQRSSQNQISIHVHMLTNSFTIYTVDIFIVKTVKAILNIPCTRIPKVFQFCADSFFNITSCILDLSATCRQQGSFYLFVVFRPI